MIKRKRKQSHVIQKMGTQYPLLFEQLFLQLYFEADFRVTSALICMAT